MSVFEERTYKQALRKAVLARKARLGRGGNFHLLARARRLNRTYLSRVFADPKTHLATDQLYLALD